MSRPPLPSLSPSSTHGKFPLSIYFFQPIESRSRSRTRNHSRCCKYRPERARFPDAANRRRSPKESLFADRSMEVARPQQQLRFPSLLSLQEVILRRDGPGERLGLTLCYETDAEDGLTDIFIDDIHPDGLAAADGRLRLGDQIIQVSSKNYARLPQIF